MSGSVEVAWWVSIVLLSIASSLIIYATLRDLGIFRLPPKTPEWPRRVYQSLDSNEGDPEPENDLVRVIEHPGAEGFLLGLEDGILVVDHDADAL